MTETKPAFRLIYPQWQGASVTALLPGLPPEDAARGYSLGARLLDMLAPESAGMSVAVPVSMEYGERRTVDGVIDRDVILEQSRAALEILNENDPARIVTLGGECSASVVPFSWLAAKYGSDSHADPGGAEHLHVVLRIAEGDRRLRGQAAARQNAEHGVALAACLGLGDRKIMELMPGCVKASNALIVGLRAYEKTGGTKERQEKLGIAGLSPAEVAQDSDAVLAWLRRCGARNVLIHFDMDVLDPAEIIAAVGVEPGGLKIEQAVRIISDIAGECNVVGLTVAEPMPRLAIRLRNMLSRLPLLADA